MPTAIECLAPGLATVTARDSAVGEEPTQFEIDLAGRELGGVEPGVRSVDLRDHGDFGDRLREAAGVVRDLAAGPTSMRFVIVSTRGPRPRRGRRSRSRDR